MGRLWGDKKNQDTFANQLFWPLRGPPILARRMRPVLYLFCFHGFKKVIFLNQETEIRNYFLRVLVAQNSCKIAPNHLGGDQKNQELIRGFTFQADFKKGITCDQKRKYAIIAFAFWSPKAAAKSAEEEEEEEEEEGSREGKRQKGKRGKEESNLFIHPPTSRSPAPAASTGTYMINLMYL